MSERLQPGASDDAEHASQEAHRSQGAAPRRRGCWRSQPSVAPPVSACVQCLEDALALRRYAALRGGAAMGLLPPDQRSQAKAIFQSERIASAMAASGKCAKCMLQVPYCICAELAALRTEIAGLGTGERVRFAVWMHVKERIRATNTGKLLEHLLPGSVVLTHEVPADAARFEAMLAESRGRAVVLYPSEGAVAPGEALAALDGPAAASGADRADQPPLLAVLVDGTWRQARRMHHQLESLLHVVLSPRERSQFAWRRQTREDRVSTVEAGALLLEDLGEARDGTPGALMRALAALNDAVARQSHYDTMANGPPQPEPTARKIAANRHRLPKPQLAKYLKPARDSAML